MRYSKVAAIIVGSVAAVGAASPAMAASTEAMPPMSLNGGLDKTLATTPVLDGGNGNAVNQATDTVMDLNNVKGDAPQALLKTAAGATPLLGGIELGG